MTGVSVPFVHFLLAPGLAFPPLAFFHRPILHAFSRYEMTGLCFGACDVPATFPFQSVIDVFGHFCPLLFDFLFYCFLFLSPA